MQNFETNKNFFVDNESEWETIENGIKRKIMGYDANIMHVNVKFDENAIGVLHHHFHSQVTYIASGEFDVTIGNETKKLTQGDSFYIPPHVTHGVVCLKSGNLIDVFSPIREDFLIPS